MVVSMEIRVKLRSDLLTQYYTGEEAGPGIGVHLLCAQSFCHFEVRTEFGHAHSAHPEVLSKSTQEPFPSLALAGRHTSLVEL